MLVIHPKDSSTAMLRLLYEGLSARVVDGDCSVREMTHLLHHTSPQERIYLLGHGSGRGLFYRKDDSRKDFDKIVVGHPHGYYLRKHPGNIVGIWCNADLFAKAEKLHGLFSGMIISEMEEADMYHVETTEEELKRENRKLAMRLRSLLDEDMPLHEIPGRMLALDDVHSPLTDFNYKNFFYL